MIFLLKSFRYTHFYLLFIIFFNISLVYSEENYKSITLDDNEKLMSQIKNNKQACELLNNKLVAYVDLVYFVKNCKLMLVNDTEISNNLIQFHGKKIFFLSDNVYSMMTLGKKYTYDEFYKDYNSNIYESQKSLCIKYDKKVVTTDNINYYLIDSCKKRPFKKYSDVYIFMEKNSPIYSIEPSILNKINIGNPIDISKNKNKLLISENEIEKKLISIKSFCAKSNNKVVSFHDSFFFLERCKLYSIIDFNLDIQKKSDELGGIIELSSNQALEIPRVGKIKSNEVLKKMN